MWLFDVGCEGCSITTQGSLGTTPGSPWHSADEESGKKLCVMTRILRNL